MQVGVNQGFLEQTGVAERPKGSTPSSRPVASQPARRPSEPIALARLKRLGRRIAHGLRDGPQRSLEGGLLDHFVRECLRGYIDVDGSGVPSYGRAHDLVSKAITREQGRLQKQVSSDWKQMFKSFTPETWRAASGALKPGGECPSFTANDMAMEWKQIWCPPSTFNGKQCAEQWK
eukprot:149379-Pyramimonas_sp.AAC.1